MSGWCIVSHFSTYFFRQGLLLIWLDWRDSKPHMSSCLVFPSSVIRGVHTTVPGDGKPSSILILAQQTLFWLSLSLALIYYFYRWLHWFVPCPLLHLTLFWLGCSKVGGRDETKFQTVVEFQEQRQVWKGSKWNLTREVLWSFKMNILLP